MSNQRKAWLTIPSARPPKEAAACLLKWYRAGYGIGIWRDCADDPLYKVLAAEGCDNENVLVLAGEYPGYGMVANLLAREVLERNPHVEFCIFAGDDTSPDPDVNPETIAAQVTQHFGGSTFCAMQPTGDPFADNSIIHIAGSVWVGREACQRLNRGLGPFHPEVKHMFGDQILKESCEKLGIYLQRPDLIQEHSHFTRIPGTAHVDWGRPIPDHLKRWNNPTHWEASKALYERLKANGFAECMPLEGK